VKLPLDDQGKLNVTRLRCTFQNLKRSTDYFPNENKYGYEIFGVIVDFKSKKVEFWFTKKNGGVALYTRKDEIITVR